MRILVNLLHRTGAVFLKFPGCCSSIQLCAGAPTPGHGFGNGSFGQCPLSWLWCPGCCASLCCGTALQGLCAGAQVKAPGGEMD